MSTVRVGICMAFDSAVMHQAKACIDLLPRQQIPGLITSLQVLDLGLSPEQIQWLTAAGATVRGNAESVAPFPGAPAYARAMTCRPYLRDLFPGHDVYMWMDADIRLVDPGALNAYARAAAAFPETVVACQEVDCTYGFIWDLQTSWNLHRLLYPRMRDVYGTQIAELFTGYHCHNAGIFAMHHHAPIWDLYRANLELACKTPFDHMKEQDALNVAIYQSGQKVTSVPATYNWLCSSAMPAFNPQTGRWVRPAVPHDSISVLHLANSLHEITLDGKKATFYDRYKQLGMTK